MKNIKKDIEDRLRDKAKDNPDLRDALEKCDEARKKNEKQ